VAVPPAHTRRVEAVVLGMVRAMCVSMGPAEFAGTILYCGRRNHPEHGSIEVLGYQNTAVNLGGGPNAMLLHLPARSMTARQFLPVGRAERVLHDMVDAVTPVAAGPGRGLVDRMGGPAAAPVEIFQHDIYTVVLAENAAFIPAALAGVERRKRPALSTRSGWCFPPSTVTRARFQTWKRRS
jgi:hypothetical protein